MPLGFGQFQIDLIAGGILVAGVARLAFDGRIQAQAEDHHIADVRHGHRLGQPVVVLLREVGAPALVEVRAGGVVHADVLAASRADALQERHIAGGSAVVIAFQRNLAIRVGADDRDGAQLILVQRQDAVVFEQHHGFARGGQCLVGVCLRIVLLVIDGVVFAHFIEQAQQVARGKRAHGGFGDLLFGDQPVRQRLLEVQIGVAAIDVAARVHGHGRAFGRGIGHFVEHMEIRDGPAIAHHVALKAPLPAQNIAQQGLAAAGGFAVYAVVRAHHGLHLALFHHGFKGREVSIPQVVNAGMHVRLVAGGLRAGMHGEMLGAGGGL